MENYTAKQLANKILSNNLLSPAEIGELTSSAITLLKNEPTLLEITVKPDQKLVVVGDIHGNFQVLETVLNHGINIEENLYVFLGDFVDREKNSHPVMQLVLALKVAYPKNIYLLRGNHECVKITEMYGFKEETIARYNQEDAEEIYQKFINVFDTLPLAARVNQNILCVHAGLSPHLELLQDLNQIDRFGDVPNEGIITDLLWSDPAEENGYQQSPRGASFTFGPDISQQFFEANNLKLMIRSHQLVMGGCEYTHDDRILTIFTSDNYCTSCQNKGGFAIVDENSNVESIYVEPTQRENEVQNEWCSVASSIVI
eukprot:TRINITY_DN2514_c0_g1_i2.p1 TRINITY_DN2514_c0_g1~~TRINITY_DN2514_c0_g1_i2.p1  ORF type:complete len:315 (-),score=65.49 TRINITY_DN2514_c0_g1_i2:50-994(-)